jgi:hypothetical protein
MFSVLALFLLTLWLFAGKIDGKMATDALIYIAGIFVAGNSISKFTPPVNGSNQTKQDVKIPRNRQKRAESPTGD